MKALLTIDHSEGAPKYLVTPKLNGTPTASILVDGVGTATMIPYFLRATLNPGDDLVAASRLLSGQDCEEINPDKRAEIISDVAITSLHLLAIGNVTPVTAAPANYTGNAYIIANTETDLADALAQLCRLSFDESEDVRRVLITTSPILGTNYMQITVKGASHAD